MKTINIRTKWCVGITDMFAAAIKTEGETTFEDHV